MATLKKLTRVGADVRQIARLLQAKAPEGHMLAYITPEEAKLLKSQGGSGKEHANTGIPSFEVGDGYGFTEDTAYDFAEPQTNDVTTVVTETQNRPFEGGVPYEGNIKPVPADAPSAQVAGANEAGNFPVTTFANQGEQPYVPYNMSYGVQNIVLTETGGLPSAMTMGAGEPQTIDTAREPSLVDRLQSMYKDMSPETLKRLGLAGGLGLLGAYQSNKAQKEAEEAKKAQQALGTPYQKKGAELQRAAQAGELTPAGQQQLQAVQAQAAQQAASRGGAVNAAQTQAQIEAFRSQLLQQQYDYGLKLSGIGDQIALGAIKTGLEADRYVQNLNNSFYTNMANIVGGMPAQAPQQYQQRTA